MAARPDGGGDGSDAGVPARAAVVPDPPADDQPLSRDARPQPRGGPRRPGAHLLVAAGSAGPLRRRAPALAGDPDLGWLTAAHRGAQVPARAPARPLDAVGHAGRPDLAQPASPGGRRS